METMLLWGGGVLMNGVVEEATGDKWWTNADSSLQGMRN